MSTQVQRRRGTSAQCDAMTPVEGEIIVDLTNDRVRVGDGIKAGGFPCPNASDVQLNAFNFAVAGGTANAITVSLSYTPSYTQPLTIKFRASNTNTGAMTINVNGLGVKNIYKVDNVSLSPLVAADIVAGNIYEIVYDGTQFQLLTLYSSGLISVSQGDLNTSTGTFSQLLNATGAGSGFIGTRGGVVTMPGGSYGFEIQTRNANLTDALMFWGLCNTSGSYITAAVPMAVKTTATIATVAATLGGQQRYITSSPPYDLGNGEVGGFFFALVNPAGEIVGTYIADAPPWAYNGPTQITATHKCPLTGKKFRPKNIIPSFEDFMDGRGIETELQEITHDLKNKDMDLIPHPFGNIPSGHSVVLLDPMSDKIQKMVSYQNLGGDLFDLTNHIVIEDSNIKRGCHKSVKACRFKLKGER